MAEDTNEMVEVVEIPEVVDIVRVAVLEGDPETGAEVNDSNAMAYRGSPWFKQVVFYCKDDQHSENGMRDAPEVHSVPLKRELVWCGSGSARGLNGDENASNASIWRGRTHWGHEGVYGQVE